MHEAQFDELLASVREAGKMLHREPTPIIDAQLSAMACTSLTDERAQQFAIAVLAELLGADAASAIAQGLAGKELTPPMIVSVMHVYHAMPRHPLARAE